MTRIIPSPKFLIVSVLLAALVIPLAAQERLLIPYRKGTKWGFCDEKKNIVIPPKYSYSTKEFDNGYAVVINRNYPDFLYGLIDKNGKEVLPVKFENIGGVYKNFALVAVKIPGNNGLDYGLIDINTGQYIIQPGKYQSIYYHSGGEFVFQTWGNQYGLIDRAGAEIKLPNASKAFDWYEGVAVAKSDWNNKYGVIDNSGRVITDFKYDIASCCFFEGLAAVGKKTFSGYKYGFVNKSGEEVIPLQYTGTYGGFVEGLASVRNNQNRLIFINKEGKQQIKDDFFEVDNFSEGIAPVRYEEGGNLFIIDKTGKKIISFSSEASQNNYYVRGGFIRVYEEIVHFLVEIHSKSIYKQRSKQTIF